MREQDKIKFAQIMTGLAEVYGKEMSKAMLEIWFQALADFEIESVSLAVSAHVRNPDNGQFFPKPADIIRLVFGTSKDAAYIAWTKVDGAMRRVGTYDSVVFDDPLIHSVVADMGGWVLLGGKTEEEWPFVSDEFRKRYAAYRQRPATEYPGKLIGIHEADNRQNGYSCNAPVFIGDKENALKVINGGSASQRLEFGKLLEEKPKLQLVK